MVLTNALIKQIVALKQKKERGQTGLFVVEGRKMIDELLKSDFQTEYIFASKSWIANHFVENIPVIEVNEQQLQRMSALTTPDSVLAVVKQRKIKANNAANSLIVALDGINNPGNLGTIIRLCAWFGVKEIVCSPDTVDCYNPKVLQSTMGAFFHTDITYQNLEEYLDSNKDKDKFAAVLDGGNNIYEQQLNDSGIIIIGNESHGISKPVLDKVNKPITIPSFAENNEVESLNASVACGVILSEFKRRKFDI